ncbi:MAG: S41 family peptidase [Myxococcota bacterium]
MTLSAIQLLFALAVPLATATEFDAKETIEKSIALLEEHYIAPERLPKITETLRREIPRYHGLTAAAFAEAVSKDLRSASRDGHLYVRALEPSKDPGTNTDWQTRERAEELSTNYGFSRVEILEDRVGYVKIVQFAEPSRAVPIATAAMAMLNTATSLVIDLRGNGGGYGGLPEYLASYFFDVEPTLLSTTYFDPDRTELLQVHSVPTIAGERRIGIPTVVLVDSGTASAAEWLAYTLQAFDKATVVGTPSAGAANMNTYFELAPGLRLSISTATPINPKTKTNWEQVGIKPDIRCTSALALECGLRFLRRPNSDRASKR